MKKQFGFLLFIILGTGCATNLTTVLSVQDATCRSCLHKVKSVVEDIPGIDEVSINFMKAETTINHQQSVTREMLLAKCSETSVTCVLGKGKGSYKSSVTFSKGSDVAWLTHKGEAIDINTALVPGKITVIDFFADWCGPCRNVDEMMVDYLEDYSKEVALRKVNIVDWDTPVVAQYLKTINGLPYAMVFNQDGKLVKKLVSFNPEDLYKLLETLRRQK